MWELAILFHVFSVPYSYNWKHGNGKIVEKEGEKIQVNII